MSFAQLTCRESLRDTEPCLLANQKKLYGMGFRSPIKRSTGVLGDDRSDHWRDLRSDDSPQCFLHLHGLPRHLRRSRFKDPESGKTLALLTNNTALPALSIAALHKKRRQVELFFKWIKQHLRIKRFIGNSENAVKTQIWRAVATCALIVIVKKEL
jgi:IS4 transposase